MCSITHGAILLDCEEIFPPRAATDGCLDDAMAPMVIRRAVKRSIEETIRRQRDGLDADVAGRFGIICIAGSLSFEGLRRKNWNPAFNLKRNALSNLFARVPILPDFRAKHVLTETCVNFLRRGLHAWAPLH